MMHINIILFIANLLYALLSNSGCYAAVSIPGYEYVGLGKCVGANGLGAFYSSLMIPADIFDPNVNCATFCNNFRSIGESFRGFDISGYYGCQCRFDAGVNEELLSPIYMSLENEVVWKDQQLNFVEETGDIITSSNFDGNDNGLNFYCYKVVPFDESSPIDDEDTECVDTQDYEDQWGGKCEEYESNAAWCGGYGAMGESGLTPNENCCVCKSKLASSTSVVIVEDAIASISSTCFDADDGGRDGVLYNAVRAYVDQNCANNQECEIGQTYGWPMNSWCVKNVKDMSYLFYYMSTFNENISDWNTSSVTDMSWMFGSARSFNGDVSNFDTSSVTNMGGMFWRAVSFNQDLSNFDTSSVTDMSRMFNQNTAFNGASVSNFDTSSVTSMESMFYGAAVFNMDLCSWQDSFPYNNAEDIFTDSGCTYQDTPQEVQKGPFCASDCQYLQPSINPSSSLTSVPVGVPLSATSPPTAAADKVAGITFVGYIPAYVDFVVSLIGLVSADEIMEGKTNQVKIMLEEQMLVLSDIVIKEEFWNGTEVESGRRLNNLGGKVVRNLIVKAAVLATLDDVQDVDCPDTSTNPGAQTLTDCLNFNNTIILHMVYQLDKEGTVEIFENAMLDKIEEGWLVDNFDIVEALKPPLQETLENSEANTIEIKLKPYADLDWRNMILFEPYVPSPIVSASCSNKCPCSDCQCGIEMVCGGTIPIDLASGNELKFVWEASSDNDKYISVTGTSQTRVEFRLTIQDCTAPYQLIHGSNVTIVIDGLDGTEQKFTHDPESSFVMLGSKYGDICDVYTRMQFNPNENGVLDMKFTTLTFTAGYDNTKVTDETSYTWATDSYTWIRQPEGGSIKMLDMLAGYSEEPWEVEETSPLSTGIPSKQMTFPDNVINEVESKAQRRQVITTSVMTMVICGVLFV